MSGKVPRSGNASMRWSYRLRIGHMRLPYEHFLLGENFLECEHFKIPLSVSHILLECIKYNRERLRHFLRIYKEHIPLHFVSILGDEPLISHTCEFRFLTTLALYTNYDFILQSVIMHSYKLMFIVLSHHQQV